MVPYALHVHHMCIPTNIDRLPVSYSNNSPAGYICFLPYFPLVTQLPIACHVAFAGGKAWERGYLLPIIHSRGICTVGLFIEDALILACLGQ